MLIQGDVDISIRNYKLLLLVKWIVHKLCPLTSSLSCSSVATKIQVESGDFNDCIALELLEEALALLEEDKMRCHIMNCLAALRVVEIQRKIIRKAIDTDVEKREIARRKVFSAACSVMIDTEFDNDEVVVNAILSSFPGESKMFDERSWLPMHFAIMLFSQNKIRLEDVHMVHATDQLAMYRLSVNGPLDEEEAIDRMHTSSSPLYAEGTQHVDCEILYPSRSKGIPFVRPKWKMCASSSCTVLRKCEASSDDATN
jgi:hypothetical protein